MGTRYTCILCRAGGGTNEELVHAPAVYNCHVCEGKRTMIPVEVQRMVREQVALELEKQHAWITNTAAANIARKMIEKD